jgi:hypothetical protein
LLNLLSLGVIEGRIILSDRKHLYNQLIKLGDMMGDGLHHEPGGAWISKEYRRVAMELGIIPKADRSARISAINDAMIKRVSEVNCKHCGGDLVQTRSGSKRAKCSGCNSRWQLLK